MTYAQMFELAAEAGLSPERLGILLGVSGMTLRRWRKEPGDRSLPVLYDRAFSAGVQQLVADGRISPRSRAAQSIMIDAGKLSFRAAFKAMGFSDVVFPPGKSPSQNLIEGLSQIGADQARIKTVELGKRKIFSFGRIGAEWKKLVQGMQSIIYSRELLAHKFIAYGALFYLLTPLDLIPDAIPVFGLLDDYALLGLAFSYYKEKFPALFSNKN